MLRDMVPFALHHLSNVWPNGIEFTCCEQALIPGPELAGTELLIKTGYMLFEIDYLLGLWKDCVSDRVGGFFELLVDDCNLVVEFICLGQPVLQ